MTVPVLQSLVTNVTVQWHCVIVIVIPVNKVDVRTIEVGFVLPVGLSVCPAYVIEKVRFQVGTWFCPVEPNIPWFAGKTEGAASRGAVV